MERTALMLSRVALIITDLNISAISTMEHQVPVKPALARTEHAATLASPSREKWLVLQHVNAMQCNLKQKRYAMGKNRQWKAMAMHYAAMIRGGKTEQSVSMLNGHVP